MQEEIAGLARAQVLHALATQAEGLAGLRAFGQRDARFALKGRNREFAAERRRHEGDGKLGVKVVAVAREDVVRLDRDLDVEVARLSAVHARLRGPTCGCAGRR